MADPPTAETLLGAIREALGSAEVRFRHEPEPIASGHETAVYTLELEGGPLGTDGPLILRLFDKAAWPGTASFEAAVHEGLLSQGFPVPEAFAARDADPAFLLMRRMPGRAVSDGVEYGGSPRDRLAGIGRLAQISVRLPRWLADTTSRLLAVDPDHVLAAADARGVGSEAFGFDRHLDALARRIERPGLEGFVGPLEWLDASRPSEPNAACVCHGDMPPNLLIDGGEVASVIDWSSQFAMVGDAAYEIANTRVLLRAPIPVPGVLRRATEAYQGALVRRFERDLTTPSGVTEERIAYYEAYRWLRALVAGADVWLDHAAGAELPKRPDPWSVPAIAERVAQDFRNATGLAVTLPPAPAGL